MPQTNQNKGNGIWTNQGGTWRRPLETIRHGDSFTFTDAGIQANAITNKGFLGGVDGLIEQTTLGAQIVSQSPWNFNNASIPGIIVNDATRGKVLYSDYNGAQLDNVQGWDNGAGIPPNTKYYASWWTRSAIKTTGNVNYPDGVQIQWKLLRVIDTDSISDTAGNAGCEFVVFNWKGGAGAQHRIENESLDYLGYAPDASVYPDINAGWSKIEYFVDTGSVGGTDGSYIVRVHKNGNVYDGIVKSGTEKFYTALKRHRYFNIENYFGNNAQAMTSKEVWVDDFYIQVGSWRRLLLTNSLNLSSPSLQINQNYSSWSSGSASGKYNLGGIQANGQFYLVVANNLTIEAYKPVLVSI